MKAESKQLMEKAGVPLVPGYHGDDNDPALLAREADRIGYPVLIKASAVVLVTDFYNPHSATPKIFKKNLLMFFSKYL